MSATVETGFANSQGAKAVARRIKMRRQLLSASQSIAALVDILDQSFEADRLAVEARIQKIRDSVAGDDEAVIDQPALVRVEGNHQREEELLKGMELLLELLDSIGVGLGHGLFSARLMAEPIEPTDPAHRLSGGAK